MPRNLTACQRCAAIKSPCNSGLPCSRCERLCLHCSYARSKHTQQPPLKAGEEQAKHRAKHKRSFSGCVGCRQRRRKCDELFPTCGDCRKRGQRCIPRVTPPVLRLESTEALDTPSDDVNHLLESSSAHHNQAEYQFDSPSSSYHEWIALIEDTGMPERPGRGTLNDSSALAKRKNPLSDRPPLRYMLLEFLTGISLKSVDGWPMTEIFLLNHFVQVVARGLVVVDDDRNPFILRIVPMAVEHLPVRRALLALSGCHVRKAYPDFQEQVLYQKDRALAALKDEIVVAVANDAILATTLLLCLLEICEGNSQRWILHLHGAKTLLKTLSSQAEAEETSFILSDLCDVLCSLATVTSDKLPLISDEAFGQGSISYDGSNQGKIHPIFGLAKDIYLALYQINELARQRTTRHNTVTSNELFLKRGKTIEQFLRCWKPDSTDISNWDFHEASASASATRWAAILRLWQVMHGNITASPEAQGALLEVLQAIARIRPGSKAESRLLFPLFMAGVVSMTKADRLMIEHRISVIETTIGTGSISSVHQLLDTVWQRMNDGEKNVDWETILQLTFPSVVLF